MAKVAKRDEDETNTDICFDDIFYLSEVRTVHSKVTNDQKNVHGGYDSGVDSISCKSNASSSSHSDILEEKALPLFEYGKRQVSERDNATSCEIATGQENASNHDWDPGTIRAKGGESKFVAFKCTKPKYGWLVVFSCFWLNVIQAGIAFCGGIVLNVIAEEFDETRSRVSIISSFFNGFLLCSAPIVERIVERFGLRITCVAGSFIAAAAFTASIFSPNLNIMIITQGVIAGIGIGLIYFPSIVAPSFYFEDNKAVAYGIGICGQGLGYALIPKLANFVLNSYNWQCVNAFFALLCFLSSIFGILLKPIGSCTSEEKGVKRIEIIIDDVDQNEDQIDIEVPVRNNQSPKPTLNYSQLFRVSCNGVCGSLAESGHGIKNNGDENHSKSTNELFPTNINGSLDNSKMTMLKNASFCLTGVSQDWYSKALYNNLPTTNKSQSKSLTRCHVTAIPDETTAHKLSPTKNEVNIHASSLLVVDLELKDEKQCGLPCNRFKFIKHLFKSSLCRDTNFIALSISNIMVFMGLGIPFAFGPDMMVQKKIMSKENGSNLITPIGMASMVIMPVIGLLIDNGPKLNPMGVTGFSLMSAGLSMISFVYCQTELVAIILATWFGISFSAILSLPPVILERLIGTEKMKSALSVLVLIRGISISVGGPIAGTIYDFTGEYDGTFHFAGALFLAGCIPMLMIYLKQRNK